MNKRSELRKNIMIALYQYRLLGGDYYSFQKLVEESPQLKKSEFAQVILYEIARYETEFIDSINARLQDWVFERLGKLEQALLLMGAAEIHANINDKAVVIDEAVKLAKIYCEEDSYKLINATLDKL